VSHPPRPHSHAHAPWSDLAGFLGCIVTGLAVLWWIAHEPQSSSRGPRQPPAARFENVTASSGVDFIHHNGARGEKLLPESMGGGVAFLDYDNDGAPDLLLINSGEWSQSESTNAPSRTAGGVASLYRNDGTGRFTNVTAGSGLDVAFYGMGVACGDFDNDGWVDVFVTGVGDHRLFKNLGGGKFADITRSAGVQAQPEQWSTSAAWLDFDNDGRLDLLVGNYVKWSAEEDRRQTFTYDGRTRAYGPPRLFPGTYPTLYHNEGGGRFLDVSARAGLQVRNPAGEPLAKTLGVAPVDLDADGWIDVILANDTVQNLVFRNEHNGTFREIGARSGIAFDAFGATRGAMGIDTARFHNDGALAIAIGNFANEMNSLYVTQNDPLHFADEAIRAGLGPASQNLLKFGLFFFDYDLDGRLDVLTANGHLDPDISRFAPRQSYRQPAQLFWNHGGGRDGQFVAVSPEAAGSDLFQPIVGRGSAFADWDGDGDLDVVLTQIGGPPSLLRNDQRLDHAWVRVRLQGRTSNRDGIGAWVRLRSGGQTLSRQVMPTKGYLSQSELVLTFGLGTRGSIEEMDVLWPSGKRQRVTGLQTNRLNVVNEIP
jgi:hypothetical protein